MLSGIMKLAEYRKLINKTQRECAEDLEIHTLYFSELERGVHEPGRKLAQEIVKWSKGAVTLADLWSENG
jgi:transcriptional regulator with XRE-family HTH domain